MTTTSLSVGSVALGRVTHIHERGYSFVELAGRDGSIFAHQSAYDDEALMQIGQRVRVTVGTDRAGRPCASRVSAAENAQ